MADLKENDRMSIGEFVQQCYNLFGKKVKIKLNHTTKGYTWEITVKADTDEEAMMLTEKINSKLIAYTNMEERDAPKRNV